jgi:hypothetical protein
MKGYLNPKYAASLSEFGEPVHLSNCDGWILSREIEGFDDYDAMGCYPIFACRDWSLFHQDIDRLQDQFVTLALVPDPFGDYDKEYLESCLDFVIPYKQHFIVKLNSPIEEIVTKHHRYYARKALKSIQVDVVSQPELFIDEWVLLYEYLIQRHNLSGIKAFSRKAFEDQLRIPGMVVLRAKSEDTTVGAHLWFQQDNIVYSHLAAFSPLGYDLMASYALYWFAIEYFSPHFEILDLGAGSGIEAKQDGLSKFKRGWASEKKIAYFCGKIFDQKKYGLIIRTLDIEDTNYFPAYRVGEY